MKCGIVILNYNDSGTTGKLLDMIQNYKVLDKIVVVDNHSGDNSYQELQNYRSDKIEVIQAEENGGYSKGNNIGVKYLIDNTDVDIIGISNSDVEFDEAFVWKIMDDFRHYKNYAVITGLQLAPDGKVGCHPFWEEYTTQRYLKKILFSLWPLSKKGGMDEEYVRRKLESGKKFFRVGAVEGSLFFVRRKEFNEAGLFDEGVFLYCEEDILAKKMKKAGKKTGVDRAVTYVHYGAATTKKVFTSKASRNHVFNSNVYYFKHYQSENRFLQMVHLVLCYLSRFQRWLIACIRERKETWDSGLKGRLHKSK